MLIKSKHKKCENIIEMNNDNDYKTGSLLDYEYFSNLYKLIVTGLSKQIELKQQQIIFIGKIENDRATMFFIIKKSEEKTFKFLKNFVSTI